MIELLLAAENTLSLGLLDQAEQTFHQVLDADPQNGIAAVGLARVTLERGDEAGALDLARAALRIDPENATARRMVDRLDEVSRHRAAALPAPPATLPAPPATLPATPAPRPDSAAAPASPAVTPTAARPVTTSSQVGPRPAPERPGLLRRLLRRP